MSTNTFWQTPKAHYELHREHDADAFAQKMVALRNEACAVVTVPGLWDGPHPYVGHDAMTYSYALAMLVEPERIIRWHYPPSWPRRRDVDITRDYARDYARDLAARREREAVAS